MPGLLFLKSWSFRASALAAAIALPAAARAGSIDPDTHRLSPEPANQQVHLFVVGSESATLSIGVGDGSRRNIGKVIAAPETSSSDFFASGSFLSHDDQADLDSPPATPVRRGNLWQYDVLGEGDSAAAGTAALLLRLTLGTDTAPVLLGQPVVPNLTGLSASSYGSVVINPILPMSYPSAASPQGGPVADGWLRNSDFAVRESVAIPAALPEPGSIGLIGIAISALLMRRRNRHNPALAD